MNQKGFGAILFILLGLILLGGVVFYMYQNYGEEFKSMKDSEMTTEETQKEVMEYENLEEDETTPEEISNEVIDELDSLMDEVDALGTEDLSDLDL